MSFVSTRCTVHLYEVRTYRTQISFILLPDKIFKVLHVLFRFDGKSVEIAKSTTIKHNYIHQLATYRGQPLTTGSQKPNHAKTEIMGLETGEWEFGPDYRFYSM